ncbi:GNAT family N-acetyltransferase [Spirosoma daeguense]
MTIRFATPADAPVLLAIYGPYILQTSITFEYDIPSETEFAERIRTIQQQLPYLVAEIDGNVAGYAYASKHRDRTAYQWSVESSVYVHSDAHRQGVARQLYTTLFDLLRRQGYYNVYAGITLPNPKSAAFHRSFGFEPIGVYKNIGYKFDAWHDVAWSQLTLQPHQLQPTPPLSITQLT